MSDMSGLFAEMVWHIDAVIDKEGWDQSPGLFAVLIYPDETTEDTGIVEMKEMPGWSMVMSDNDDPKIGLALMVALMMKAPEELKRSTYPPELYGLAFSSEAWMLVTHKGEDEAKAEIARYYDGGGKIADRPDRIECRMIYAVSVSGEFAALNHERDGIAQAWDSSTDGEVVGVIPDLLKKLMQETTK